MLKSLAVIRDGLCIPLTLVCFGLSTANSQTAVAPNPLPLGKQVLKKRIAPAAAWVIDMRPSKNPGEEGGTVPVQAAKAAALPLAGETLRVFVERTQHLTHVQIIFTGGSSEDRWSEGNRQITSVNGVKNLTFLEPEADPSHNYTKTDFPELDWIGNLTAVREVDAQGQKGLLFEADEATIKRMFPAAQPPDQGEEGHVRDQDTRRRSAIINVATGLPSVMVKGDQVASYSYQPAPARLEMPANFRAALEQRDQSIKNSMPPASQP